MDGDGDADVLSSSFNDDTIAWFRQENVSDPNNPNTDGDLLLDGFEFSNGFDPFTAGKRGPFRAD